MSNQFRHLNHRFKRLQEWNSVYIRIWTTKIERFKVARVGSIVLVSLVLRETFQCLFHSCTLGVRDCLQLVWIAGCSKATRIKCVTSRVMVMYYTWTRIITLLSSSIWRCLMIVSYLSDWYKTLTWVLTTSHKSGWLPRTCSNALSTIVLVPLHIHSALSTSCCWRSTRADAQALTLDDDIALITPCTCFLMCSLRKLSRCCSPSELHSMIHCMSMR